MKEKLKKLFNKDRLFIWICTILIVLFVTMSVLFLKKDIEDNKNKQSEISLCDTEINLNTSWTINSNGDLVGNNLFNANTMISRANVIYNVDSQRITITTQNNDPYIFISNLNLNNGTTYYVKMFSQTDSTAYMWDDINGPLGTSFVYDSTMSYHIEFEGYIANNIGTYDIYISISTSELLEWEPYLSMV